MQQHLVHELRYRLGGRLALEQVGAPGGDDDEAGNLRGVDTKALHEHLRRRQYSGKHCTRLVGDGDGGEHGGYGVLCAEEDDFGQSGGHK